MRHVDVVFDSPTDEQIGDMKVGTMNDLALSTYIVFRRILLLYHDVQGRCFFEAWSTGRGCVPTFRPGALNMLRDYYERTGSLE